MLDQQYVESLSRGPGLGLADVIVRQVQMARGDGLQKTPTAAVTS
jgi:Rod binding domain-containing protein